MPVITTSVVTPNLTATRTSADGVGSPGLGTIVNTTDGGVAIYVRAMSTVAQYDAVVIVNTSSATGASIAVAPITTTNAATGARIGFAQTALASGEYGWVYTSGNNLRVKTLIACQPAVPLFTTATAGSLDDTTVTAGYCLGVVLMSSATSASAPPCTAGNTVVRTWGGG